MLDPDLTQQYADHVNALIERVIELERVLKEIMDIIEKARSHE